MSKVSTSMVKPILRILYEQRKEMVPCFIGAPGIGKTQGIYEFAEEIGANVVTFILSNTVPSEVSGIRMPDQESKKLEVFDDSRMASLQDGDILFFDEILEAPPMLWSACLTLIQDRIMASGRKLPDVFIVAASNPVASPAIIPASTRDRFQFIELEFDSDHWCEWFRQKYHADPGKITKKIREDSDQYNILTPRRVVKLYETLKAVHDSREMTANYRQVVENMIVSMFDVQVYKELLAIVKQKASPQEQISKAIEEMCIADREVIAYNVKGMSLKEIMQYLSQLPEWDEIQLVLANVQFEEED